MTIPSWPGFPILDPVTGDAIDGAKGDQALGHLYAYRSVVPAEVRAVSTAWTLTANDLDTYWGYNHGSNVTWTLPAGLNPVIDVSSVDTASGGRWILIEQHGTGQVTVTIDAALTVIKPAALTTIRTDGVGTGLFIWYWQDDKALVSVRAF